MFWTGSSTRMRIPHSSLILICNPMERRYCHKYQVLIMLCKFIVTLHQNCIALGHFLLCFAYKSIMLWVFMCMMMCFDVYDDVYWCLRWCVLMYCHENYLWWCYYELLCYENYRWCCEIFGWCVNKVHCYVIWCCYVYFVYYDVFFDLWCGWSSRQKCLSRQNSKIKPSGKLKSRVES